MYLLQIHWSLSSLLSISFFNSDCNSSNLLIFVSCCWSSFKPSFKDLDFNASISLIFLRKTFIFLLSGSVTFGVLALRIDGGTYFTALVVLDTMAFLGGGFNFITKLSGFMCSKMAYN
eukprot:NODE_543_length_6878_cov_0.317008.p5 type:complete len:118 gc:universal NODE_543_length_6878_cov_0.317008:2280-1927(-)